MKEEAFHPIKQIKSGLLISTMAIIMALVVVRGQPSSTTSSVRLMVAFGESVRLRSDKKDGSEETISSKELSLDCFDEKVVLVLSPGAKSVSEADV
ncbi:MAG: hypothetical protein JO215_15695 [Ktedonobacteraceae bacterium]|nr:hypothetical protein [Ktedonobacteraceae bacterium]